MYKIVHMGKFCGKETYSSLMAIRRANTHYEIGKWVQAPEWLRKLQFGLTCFETLEDCIVFLSSRGQHGIISAKDYIHNGVAQVFECECDGELIEHPSCSLNELGRGVIIENPISRGWPDGTMFFEKIKITKLVPHKELMDVYNKLYGKILPFVGKK